MKRKLSRILRPKGSHLAAVVAEVDKVTVVVAIGVAVVIIIRMKSVVAEATSLAMAIQNECGRSQTKTRLSRT